MKYSLDDVLTKPEDLYFDRKSASINIDKLVETIIGFANANGGSIAIGIKDKQFQGINSQGNIKINDFIQCPFTHCIPSIQIDHYYINGIKENGNEDRILVLEIPPSINQVHTTQADACYLRVGDETIKLNHNQRIDLEYDKNTRFYETTIIENCYFDDFDLDVLNEYKKSVKYKFDDLNKLLQARGFAIRTEDGKYKYNAAAVLMFCNYPTSFIPGAKVRFIRYEGTVAETGTRMNIIKEETFEGPIPLLITEIKKLVQSQLREFTALNSTTGKFHTVPEYPPFAWQEGIVNALTHRAYNIHGDDIKIFMYDDRLEIHSPGNLPYIVNINNIKEVRYSRNPRIARALTELGWVRELGEGVKRIYEEMENFFLDDPIFLEEHQTLKLILKNNIIIRKIRKHERINDNISGKWDELTNREKIALEIVYNKGKIKTKELADKLNLTRQPAKKVLDGLVDKNILIKICNSERDPNQHYEMNSFD